MARDGNSEKMTKRSRRRRCSTKTNVEGEQSRTLFTGPEFRGGGDEDTSSEPLSSSMTTNDLRVPPSTPLSPVHRRIVILNDEIPKRRFWFDDDINVRSTVLTVLWLRKQSDWMLLLRSVWLMRTTEPARLYDNDMILCIKRAVKSWRVTNHTAYWT